MKEEIFRIYGKSVIITIGVAFFCFFLDVRISWGALLGCMCNGIYTYFLVLSTSALLDRKEVGSSFALAFLIKLIVLVLPFLVAVLFPKTVHFLGAILALFIFRAMLFLPRKK